MKKLLPFLAVLLFCLSLNGQRSVNRFIDKMKEHKNAYALTLPGWLIRTGISIATKEELKFEEGFQELVEGIKRFRVLFINDNVDIPNSKLRSVVSQIKEKDGYVDYASVKDDDNLVQVIVKEEGTKIKSLVVVANAEDGFTILNLKTDIEMEDLKNANLSFNKSKKTQL
ncbi:MAG: DUF4252 domain-containing protein [Bacteroidota bacterium]